MREYISKIIQEINEGLHGTVYKVDGFITIKYKDGENMIEFVVTNQQ